MPAARLYKNGETSHFFTKKTTKKQTEDIKASKWQDAGFNLFQLNMST